MNDKKNISILSNCYGCGVCVPSCPVKIIDLKENKNGFYSPVIVNQDKCIGCGICLDVCTFNHSEVAPIEGEVKSYAGWSNDENVRLRCSSGGVGFELGKKLIEEGYVACGVRYNPNTNRAEHYLAETVEEFAPSVGSKYIPSFTSEAFTKLVRGKKYFITGTPCQIDSFRRYIRRYKIEQNFVLMDFFCHGVPSLLLWDKYTSELEKKIGKITFASWRNKTTGWHDSWAISADENDEAINWQESYNLKIKEKKHFYFSRLTQGDLFYKFFLGNFCLNHCCYKNCKYKICSSSADIRIGDLWGTKYEEDTKGVNAIVSFTPRGEELLNELGVEACNIISEPVGIVTEGQMPSAPSMPWVRGILLEKMRGADSLAFINSHWIRLYAISILPKRVVNKIFRMLKLKPLFH